MNGLNLNPASWTFLSSRSPYLTDLIKIPSNQLLLLDKLDIRKGVRSQFNRLEQGLNDGLGIQANSLN